jgi:hypothetical protein
VLPRREHGSLKESLLDLAASALDKRVVRGNFCTWAACVDCATVVAVVLEDPMARHPSENYETSEGLRGNSQASSRREMGHSRGH